ncbi:hypothetical protein RFI_23935, partial [Reticulomyxa filosa]
KKKKKKKEVFITPPMVTWIIGQDVAVDIGTQLIDLALKVVTPFIVGQIARNSHPRAVEYIDRYLRPYSSKIVDVLVFVIVAMVIANSMCSHAHAAWQDVIGLLFVCLFLHIFVFIISYELPKYLWRWKFSWEDRIAIAFCSSQKSITIGVVMYTDMYGNGSELALYILPLMIYFPIFTVLDGFIAQYIKKQYEKQRDVDLLADAIGD